MTKHDDLLQPEDILRWFRGGADTAMLADLLNMPESVIANMLAKARENERNQADPAVPPERQSPLEND